MIGLKVLNEVKIGKMNERIKELYDIAQGSIDPMDKNGNVMEKFANLILQECASLFPMIFTDEQYPRRIDKTIKKHFGVE